MVKISLWRPDIDPTGPVAIPENDVPVQGDGRFVATATAPRDKPKSDHYLVEVRVATMDGGIVAKAPFLVHV
jgi:hypothetical protein